MADRLCRAEGIEIAKAQGKYKGRKPIEIDWDKFSRLYGEWKAKTITVLPSRLLLDRLANGNAPLSRPILRSGNFIAEKKSPQKRLQSVSESLRLFVSIGFVPVVVCSTMLKWTCMERKTGVPIGYIFLYHYSNAIIYYHLDMNSFITDWHS